jgi:anti-sigma factor RsiW
MTGGDEKPPDDSELTAYLDGQLPTETWRRVERWTASDDATRLRLEELARGGRPFKEAFALLTEAAPRDRLARMLDAIEPPRRRRVWASALVAAAALLLFVGGGVMLGRATAPGGALFASHTQTYSPLDNWRVAVATYFSLQTSETMAGIPDDATAKASELTATGAQLGLWLSAEKASLPGLDLKRAELYRFRGAPLAEFLYSGSPAGPIAFCIIVNGKPDADMQIERRNGFNIVFWQHAQRGYLLIGKTSPDELRQQANIMKSRFGA